MPIQKILLVDDQDRTAPCPTADQARLCRAHRRRTARAMRRRRGEADLILMDVVMPGQNGFQRPARSPRDPRFTDVPVIMCTSKNQETDKVWGMRQGRATTSSAGRSGRAGGQDPRLRLTGTAGMAKKEALRELQSRLASGCRRPAGGAAAPGWPWRWPAAPAVPRCARRARFSRWTSIVPVPHTHRWFMGCRQPARPPARRGRPGGLPRRPRLPGGARAGAAGRLQPVRWT